MASLVCNLKEFIHFFNPRIKQNVTILTKPYKEKLGCICEICGKKMKILDAAHKHGRKRLDIIKQVLEEYKISDDTYKIDDLERVINQIDDAHKPVEDCFLILCKKCHKKYDSQ